MNLANNNYSHVNSHDAIKRYLLSLCKQTDLINNSLYAFLPEKDRYKRLYNDLLELQKQTIQAPLFGLTVGVKDIFHVDGLPTQAGSTLPPFEFQGKQANLVSQLKGAGALILGKTVTTEFTYMEPNETVKS